MKIADKLLKSQFSGIFLIALLFNLILLPFFFHPDLKTIFCKAQYLSAGVLNIYEFLDKNRNIMNVCSEFSYPPLYYFFLGILYPLINLFGGSNFSSWLMMGNMAVNVDQIFRYLFITKLPFVLFEFLTAILIIKFLDDEKLKRYALILWFFNPANLYIIALMGQLDIIPAFLTVLSVYLALKKQKYILGALALGVSAALKSYSLFFLPFYGIIVGRNWRQKFTLMFIGLLPYALSMVPFLKYESFRSSVLLSGLSQRMFMFSWPLGFGENIQVVLLGIGLLLLKVLSSKIEHSDLLKYFGSVALVFLAGSHFHPQWFIWSLPFLSILVAKNQRLIPAFILLIIGWIGVTVMYDDLFLTFGLMSPLDSSVFSLPPFRELVKGFMDPNQIQSMFHTLFTASSIWIIYSLFNNHKEDEAQ
jgi:hypothetical protein